MTYTIEHIADIIGAKSRIGQSVMIENLLLDSRKIYTTASSLFFAITGTRRDGHQFIAELYKKGIRSFVVSRPIDIDKHPGSNILQVADTTAALQQLAAFHRSQFKIPVIGLTGSNGKTIVKEWLYQLLHEDFEIVRSPKSYNSQIGVPLSVWQMNASHTLAIFEAGISKTGEMASLAQIIQPTVGVITNIGEAHSEGFTGMEEKVKEKLLLFNKQSLPVIYPAAYPEIAHESKIFPFSSFAWGAGEEAWLKVIQVTKHRAKTEIEVWRGSVGLKFEIPFTDDASVENALTCCAVMLKLEIPVAVIQQRMAQLQPVNMRLELKKGINHCLVINDSYSADLSSLEMALNFLVQKSGTGKKVVILSDFLESGLLDHELYKKIANSLVRHQISSVIGIGEKITVYLTDALAHSSVGQEYYPTTESFIQHYRFSQFKDEAILVKGARSFEFEKIVRQLEQKVHQTVLEINLNAIGHNLTEYQKVLKPSTKIMAMVKAFAYGSGGAEIAGILQYHKVDYLGVAYADEGVELRNAGVNLPVMVMNPEESAFDTIIEHNLEPEIYSFEILDAFSKLLLREGLQHYPIHIEIETGMNRLGFSTNDIEKLGTQLQSLPSVRVQSVFSHLAASEDAAQDAFSLHQFDLFNQAASKLEQKLGYSFIKHIANSAAAIRHPNMQLDMVRLGIGLYGIDGSHSQSLHLQPVATLKSTVSQIKKVKKGESVSYNRKGVVTQDSVIATIRLGYADGYPRRLGNGQGKVWVKGRLFPVIGTVCMDMFMIDITGANDVQEGDEVIVFGKQLSVEEVASLAGTIPYEIMTGISQRVKRVYFEE